MSRVCVTVKASDVVVVVVALAEAVTGLSEPPTVRCSGLETCEDLLYRTRRTR